MHEIGQKLKLLIFFLNFDLAKGGASAPLASLVAPLRPTNDGKNKLVTTEFSL